MVRPNIILCLSALLASSTLLSACGGGGGDGADEAGNATVAVYTSTGALQCSGGGQSVATLRSNLLSAGVTPTNDGDCGDDGQAHVAMCGALDGSIAVFDVPTDQLSVAQRLGYAALNTLPQAKRTQCATR